VRALGAVCHTAGVPAPEHKAKRRKWLVARANLKVRKSLGAWTPLWTPLYVRLSESRLSRGVSERSLYERSLHESLSTHAYKSLREIFF
jgi:hypothetical protein